MKPCKDKWVGCLLMLQVCASSQGLADPLRPVLRIDAAPEGNGVSLTWATTTGVVYQLEQVEDLKSRVWQAVGGYQMGEGVPLSALDSTRGACRRLYRLNVSDVVVARAADFGAPNGVTLQNLLLQIGDQPTLVRVDNGVWTITNSVHIPSNVMMRVEVGSCLAGPGALVFNGGRLTDASRQVFDPGLAVRGLRQLVRPEWWGLATEAGRAVNGAALASAVRAADRSVVQIPAGVYAVGTLQLQADEVAIQGRQVAVFDPLTGACSGGTCLDGALTLTGTQYVLQDLSVRFVAGGPDPLTVFRGHGGRVSHCTFMGDRSDSRNLHNVVFSGTNTFASYVETRDCGGHGFVSKAVGLQVEHVKVANCRYGITIKSGGEAAPIVASSNAFCDIVISGQSVTSDYGIVVFASEGLALTDLSIADFCVSNVYMGVNIEAGEDALLRCLTFQRGRVMDCQYGYRSFMPSSSAMDEVALIACRSERCAGIGFFQQATGAWVDVLSGQAVDCAIATAGTFRTADIAIVTQGATGTGAMGRAGCAASASNASR